MEDAVIVSAVRTAIGKFGGSLASVPAPKLGSIVIAEALARVQGRTRRASRCGAQAFPMKCPP